MENFIELILQQSITFFAILDPIGASAIMLSLLNVNVTKQQMQKIAYKSTITVVIAFFMVLIAGTLILSLFGIDENSLKVIGGIVLILMAIQMLQGSKQTKALSKEEDKDINSQDDLSVIPIAIPITFGSGMFSTIIILKHGIEDIYGLYAMIISFLLNAIILYFVFKNSIYIKEYLGITGQNIITKLMALIVGAIAVQFIISGTITLSLIYIDKG
jgi:multiple antibiotic resistance protein